ncbi:MULTISPECIES: YwpF-like family protein [Pontibacillus]|uniref:YwpF-like family protein n=1 Tax=Pontibacillus chungwhensis TaxID=265426 RepID=A0ABY8V2S5_9BACI|nr:MULTISPECIES: YwpF-like family protein [Pontibacillus]MCD5322463.1 YwpF-like family protein [Pontibacillus sp. HN14]WIF99748.1 YwpF-like family protein [Pontibacillus chungwhensis]
MKTFKLIKLNILKESGEDIQKRSIPLIDGLIINREDDQNRWIIEAYLDKQYFEEFEHYQQNEEEMVLEAKITKSTNHPAVFLVKVLDVNEIGEHFNVLFMGTIVDHKKDQVEHMLRRLIEEGYQGEELLNEFKNRVEQAEAENSV